MTAGTGSSRLAGNAAKLYAAHLLGLLVPLITVPYLARVLRPEGWGPVLVAQSLGLWLVLIQEYGFDLSGTRAVARVGRDPKELARAATGIQNGKLLVLLFLLVPLGGLLFWLVPLFRRRPDYLLWAWVYGAARGFLPNWYYLGREQMTPIALFEGGARVAAALGIFLVVTTPEHGWRVLALQASCNAAAVLWLTLRMHQDIGPPGLDLAAGRRMLRRSMGIFIFRGASGLYMQANAFILGLLATPAVVAVYGGAEKLIRALVGLIQPISQAFFPRLSHLMVRSPSRAEGVFRLSFLVVGGMGLAMALGTYFSADLVVTLLLGEGYEAAVPVLRTFAVLPPIIAVGTLFGIHWALPAGLERPFYSLVVLAGGVNLLLAFLLVPILGAMGMVASVLTAEFLVAGGLVVVFRWRGGRVSSLNLPDPTTNLNPGPSEDI